MGKLTDDEIKTIIKRASILQKYHEQAPGASSRGFFSEKEPVFEIADSLNIERHFVREALLELHGSDTEDPIFVDTGSQSNVELIGTANGELDGGLLNELKAQLEYHFNTVGTIERRKGNVYWKASPAFPSKLFEITSSPRMEFSERNGRIKIRLQQSLKTLNKLYAPALAATFGSFMMISAVIFEAARNDEGPLIVVSGILLLGSFAYARFIKSRKQKRKVKLKELVETLQQIMERRYRAGRLDEATKPQITIDDIDVDDEVEIDVDLPIRKRIDN